MQPLNLQAEHPIFELLSRAFLQHLLVGALLQAWLVLLLLSRALHVENAADRYG